MATHICQSVILEVKDARGSEFQGSPSLFHNKFQPCLGYMRFKGGGEKWRAMGRKEGRKIKGKEKKRERQMEGKILKKFTFIF